ncbi:ABC transporter permease [Hoeflea prorocentri]|uniref:Iron ABC transporter permease n=1 Tax=Hoeflea prorocentri TaxID=1922333 RepID=A0A9X3UK82_9HYPH|nr:iron ABC transporter permease [Hoeflea prorocentri]MCY6382345.1 iron ABC transporter permease [Hoeflea prorocentri]MDA5400145.1 iron ABC transporter permease [Hoeflea prorocentri]
MSMPQLFVGNGSIRSENPVLLAFAGFIALFVLVPVAALVYLAVTGQSGEWPHLIRYVIPRAVWVTGALLTGVAILAGSMGILSAWLVVSFDFPGRRTMAWALVLPFAVPTYLAAYAYGEFLDYTGPLQSGFRALFGYTSRADYWFPEVRSLPGAMVVLSSVLYPYVYLTTRALFLMQGRSASDVARTLGASRLSVFWRVQLPMARPALAIGITLALMETLNDIGAVEYLGVNTLTFAIYDTWLNRGDLAGAVQIACAMLFLALLAVLVERWGRRRQRYNVGRTTSAVHDVTPVALTGVKKWAATVLCALPILLGFGIPAYILGGYAFKRLDQLLDSRIYSALADSLMVSSATALCTVLLAFVLAYAARVSRQPLVSLTGKIASFGYAVPGTVLALGVLIPLASLDTAINTFTRNTFGFGVGLILTGSGLAIIYACSIRFLTMAEGSIESGFHKLSPHLDMAARTLGRNARETFSTILLPMMKPAVVTAALLVFVDTLKELSATLLLRPFDFNTLATLVYEDASRARVEEASVAAFIIILAGILPVILVSRSMIDNGNRFRAFIRR